MVYIERELEKEISKYLPRKEILAIVGPRQCGKTTMINKILESLKEKKKKIENISFDNIKTLQLFNNDIDSFIKIHVENFDILFIDEIHYSKNSGQKLKYIYDNFKTKLIISGSSAAEISIQSLKFLVGRILTFNLYPFSFKEFLKAKEPRLIRLYEMGEYKKELTSIINSHLKEFILYGGYPNVVLSNKREEKQKVLEGIYNTYFLKEIKEILELSENSKLINLLKALSLQIGNIANYNELSKITGFSYSDIKKHLNILEKTYVCELIEPFHTNKRTELIKNPKIYFFDLGFRNICIDNFTEERSDKGVLYENFIFSEIIKKNINLKFWNTKSKAEVDFIIERQNKIIPIEIKSLIKETKIPRSFNSFLEQYKPKKGYILSLDFEDRKTIGKTKIEFLPFVKFTGKNNPQ